MKLQSLLGKNKLPRLHRNLFSFRRGLGSEPTEGKHIWLSFKLKCYHSADYKTTHYKMKSAAVSAWTSLWICIQLDWKVTGSLPKSPGEIICEMEILRQALGLDAKTL
ncbi:hypothetical protein Baya_12234 [Bagarius yarrelli]|uniref:Uncharacterized protein n=1 Tax=Bagarius yarrelli TaxID=175774 RepID=A0A556V2E5_BAGYA|nr:hypothetical protein Baya_12234 [Bagarius yarrelli]